MVEELTAVLSVIKLLFVNICSDNLHVIWKNDVFSGT